MTSLARVPLLLFAVAWGANHFVPLLLAYRASMRLSPVDLAILFAAYALGLLPGLLLGGPVSDRRGRRAVVLPSAIVALAGTLLLGGATGFSMLLVGRLVVGAGCGAAFTAGTAWVQDMAENAPEGARRAATALSAGFGGGPLVSSVVAQWLPSPMVTPYVVHAVVLAVAIAFAWRAPNVETSDASRAAQAQPRDVPARRALPPGFGREIAPVAPWVFAFPSIAFAVFPALVRQRVGSLAIVYAGAVTATTLLAGMLTQLLVRRITARRAAAAGMASGTVGLAVGLFATAEVAPAGVFVAGIFLGAGYGACLVAGLRWVAAAALPGERGRVLGVFYALTYVGFASPLVLAAIARRASDAVGIGLATALALLVTAYTAGRRWGIDRAR